MLRNYLKGSLGNEINILITAAAFNFKKKLNRIKVELLSVLIFVLKFMKLKFEKCDFFRGN